MMKASLNLERRQAAGGRQAKRLRNGGYVPGVVYGKHMDPITIKIKATAFRDFLSQNGRNAVFDAVVDSGESFPALVKEIQMGIIKKEFVHIDFQQVSLTEQIQVNVPVRLEGKGSVERADGVVVQQMNEITVSCLAQDIPQLIEVDISNMEIGDNLTAGELTLPEGVVLITEPGDLVLSIASGAEKEEDVSEAEDDQDEENVSNEVEE